eukprot:gene6674-6898_t
MTDSKFKFLCFSDIDGTLVHYLSSPQQLQEGIISVASIQKAAALRKMGAAFVIVSGARTATVLQRLPYLPAADAVIAENGGRIWYPDPAGLTMCPLQEDLPWRELLSAVTGPVNQDIHPPLERQGLLWDWYRQLHQEGWSLDSNSYSTCFRLMKTANKTDADLDAAIARRPAGIASSFNIGVADFYPDSSGKHMAAAHLMRQWGVTANRCVLLCDDDNDLQLAAVVGKAFLPSISHESVTAAVAAAPEKFVVSDVKWTGGTEQMLDAVAQVVQREAPKLTRGVRTSAPARGGYHYDFEHGPNYLNFQDWPGRQWKVGAWITGIVISGVGVPMLAVWWQQAKARGG